MFFTFIKVQLLMDLKYIAIVCKANPAFRGHAKINYSNIRDKKIGCKIKNIRGNRFFNKIIPDRMKARIE